MSDFVPDATNVHGLDISNWNVSSVANMQAMFFWEQQRSMMIFPGMSLPSSA
jgi:surface protein